MQKTTKSMQNTKQKACRRKNKQKDCGGRGPKKKWPKIEKRYKFKESTEIKKYLSQEKISTRLCGTYFTKYI